MSTELIKVSCIIKIYWDIFLYILFITGVILVCTFFSFDLKIPFILSGATACLIFMLKRNWLVYAIVVTLFLEARTLSFYFFGARIRITQIFEIVGLFGLLLAVLIGETRLKKTPIDLALWAYIGINFIAISNAVWFARSLKIAVLLLSLALLYYLIVNLITTNDLFNKAFNLLLYMGLLEISFGIYQILAGICNVYIGTNFPIGHLGMIHESFINCPWGRPYGTFTEPDWYGVICAFYAILFITLFFSRIKEKKRLYFFGMIFSGLGLFFSFVRTGWIGFLGGFLFVSFFSHNCKLSKLSVKSFVKGIILLGALFLILNSFFPTMKVIFKSRFTVSDSVAPFGPKSPRFIAITDSMKLFLKHPIIGNGPGNYSSAGTWSADLDQMVAEGKLSIETRYNPNIIATVFEDTGIIGVMLFFLLLAKIAIFNLKTIPLLHNKCQIISLGLFGGLVGLFVSYNFSTGFWIPFTWVFLAFNIASLRLRIFEK